MLESSPIIREANLCDAPRLADIYNYYITQTTVTFETEAITAEEMQHRIAEVKEQGLPYLVCECSGKIVGYSYVHPWRTRAAFLHSKELSVYFDHTCRHKGWGSQIVRAIMCRLPPPIVISSLILIFVSSGWNFLLAFLYGS